MASLRIWLKKSVKTEKMTNTYGHQVDSVDGLPVKTHEKSGRKYVDLGWSCNPMDPSQVITLPSRRVVDKFTFRDEFSEGLRLDGVYKYKGAVLLAETSDNSQLINSGYGQEWHESRVQKIGVSAGGLRTLREIVAKFRQGELEPVERWSR